MTKSVEAKLFSPINVGPISLKHRVVMAPLTRSRSVQPGNIPGDLMVGYYSQRASDGGLIVSEGTSISIAAGGWFGAPGLYSVEQVAGWRRITNAVHGKRAGTCCSNCGIRWACCASGIDERHKPRQFFGQRGVLARSNDTGVYASRMATAFASPCARHHRNSGHRRGLSESRRVC